MDQLQIDDSDSDVSSTSSHPEGAARSYNLVYILVEPRGNKYIAMAKRILPRLSLYLMLFGYILMGAAIIHKIEGANEPVQRDLELRPIFDLRDHYDDLIWNITQDSKNKTSREALKTIQKEYFEKLAQKILTSSKNQLINEKHLTDNENEDEQLWTYSNSIFFATTVITTIGYGTLVPTTTLGRIATIIFALLGVPLLHVTITDMGKFVSELICNIYYQFYVSLKRKFKMRQLRRRRPSASSDDLSMDEALRFPIFLFLLVLLTYTAAGGFLFQASKELNYSEGLFSSFSVMATIGYTDSVPTSLLHMFFTIVYILVGLSISHMFVDWASTRYIQKMKVAFKYLEEYVNNASITMKAVKNVVSQEFSRPAPQAV